MGDNNGIESEFGRRDVLHLLLGSCMPMVVGCGSNRGPNPGGCDPNLSGTPNGITITNASVVLPQIQSLPAQAQIRVGFKLTGTSSTVLASAKLSGSLDSIKFAELSGRIRSSTIHFSVETKGRAAKRAISAALLAGSMVLRFTLQATLSTQNCSETVYETWSKRIQL